ncbi:hypothetical protein EBV26_17535 [bacterium]|nr:hypothetical protein [bacterium]
MFVNGNKVGSGASWTTTYQFSIQVKPGDIIAVDGIDKGGPAAFIGVFNGKPTKATEWRCSTQEVSGWKMNSFDDSQWQHAISYGRNQDGNIWNSVGRGPRPNIPSDAEWLWTYNNENHNRVYCRYLMTPAPAPAPAPAPVVSPVRTVSDEVTVPNAADTDANANADSDDDNNDTPIATSNTSTTDTKQSVIDEIIRDKEQSNSKLTKFQEKLFRLLKENSDEQIKVETENRNNFNSVSVSLNDEKVKLESVHSNMIALYDEIQNLNRSIQSHYNKLISDTNYLQSLDEMRPTFLKSLDDLASHIQNVKIVVDNKIVNDEYKDEMIRLLTGIHFNTHNISGYVATAFINHYNKYKNRIQKENTDYLNDVKRLNELSSEYSVQKQVSIDIERDRVRLENIFLKMKETLEMSISQRAEFDTLVKEVVAIFDKKRC